MTITRQLDTLTSMLSLPYLTNKLPLHALVIVSIVIYSLTSSYTAHADQKTSGNRASQSSATNNKYAPIFKQAAAKYGISETVLRSICEVESQNNPWAFNVNGEGFQPSSLADALSQIDNIHSRPWLLKLSFKRQASTRLFYQSEKDAELALGDILKDAKHWGFEAPQKTHIRLLDVKSTDIGYMQINWRFHGRHFNSIADLYDPAINIDYSARYIKKLIRRHGSMSKAVAFYHSNTQRYQAIYLDNFWPIYQKHILLARG